MYLTEARTIQGPSAGLEPASSDECPAAFRVAWPAPGPVPSWTQRPDDAGTSMENERLPAQPFRLLLHVPVPWVFVLTYLLGVALERAWPTRPEVDLAPRLILIGGGFVFAAGAVLAAWGRGHLPTSGHDDRPRRSSSRLVTGDRIDSAGTPCTSGSRSPISARQGSCDRSGPLFVLPLLVGYLNWVVIPLEEMSWARPSAWVTTTTEAACLAGSRAQGP